MTKNRALYYMKQNSQKGKKKQINPLSYLETTPFYQTLMDLPNIEHKDITEISNNINQLDAISINRLLNPKVAEHIFFSSSYGIQQDRPHSKPKATP